jgi:hypothetical protein
MSSPQTLSFPLKKRNSQGRKRMEILRDPIWQFIGVVLSTIIGVAALIVAIKASQQNDSRMPSSTPTPSSSKPSPRTRTSSSTQPMKTPTDRAHVKKNGREDLIFTLCLLFNVLAPSIATGFSSHSVGSGIAFGMVGAVLFFSKGFFIEVRWVVDRVHYWTTVWIALVWGFAGWLFAAEFFHREFVLSFAMSIGLALLISAIQYPLVKKWHW